MIAACSRPEYQSYQLPPRVRIRLITSVNEGESGIVHDPVQICLPRQIGNSRQQQTRSNQRSMCSARLMHFDRAICIAFEPRFTSIKCQDKADMPLSMNRQVDRESNMQSCMEIKDSDFMCLHMSQMFSRTHTI